VGTNPADHLIFTHNWGPDIIHEEYMLQSHALWYTGSEWSIYNETETAIDTNLAFNVLNPQTNGISFTHTVTVANSYFNVSYIDNPALNNTPSAVFFISKSWENGIYDTAHVGIWYDDVEGQWTVYNEDPSLYLQINSTYNIFIPDAATSFYKHTATSNSYITWLDNPLLNGNPYAKIFIVHDYTNIPTSEGHINDELGVWYDGSSWTIYNENPYDTLFTGATFNVLIIRDNPEGIVKTTRDAGKIKVTPNPAGDNITVLLNSSYLQSLKEIRLSSMDGRTLFYKSYHGDSGKQLIFDISSEAQGLYILTAVTGEGTLSTRVNIVR
jgi:hypothetical protein